MRIHLDIKFQQTPSALVHRIHLRHVLDIDIIQIGLAYRIFLHIFRMLHKMHEGRFVRRRNIIQTQTETTVARGHGVRYHKNIVIGTHNIYMAIRIHRTLHHLSRSALIEHQRIVSIDMQIQLERFELVMTDLAVHLHRIAFCIGQMDIREDNRRRIHPYRVMGNRIPRTRPGQCQ